MSLETFRQEFLARNKLFRNHPMKFFEVEGTLYCQAYNESEQKFYGNKFKINREDFSYTKAV